MLITTILLFLLFSADTWGLAIHQRPRVVVLIDYPEPDREFTEPIRKVPDIEKDTFDYFLRTCAKRNGVELAVGAISDEDVPYVEIVIEPGEENLDFLLEMFHRELERFLDQTYTATTWPKSLHKAKQHLTAPSEVPICSFLIIKTECPVTQTTIQATAAAGLWYSEIYGYFLTAKSTHITAHYSLKREHDVEATLNWIYLMSLFRKDFW